MIAVRWNLGAMRVELERFDCFVTFARGTEDEVDVHGYLDDGVKPRSEALVLQFMMIEYLLAIGDFESRFGRSTNDDISELEATLFLAVDTSGDRLG